MVLEKVLDGTVVDSHHGRTPPQSPRSPSASVPSRIRGSMAFSETRPRVLARQGRRIHTLILPRPEDEVMPGVRWGHPAECFTPAYWRTQAWFAELSGDTPRSHALGSTLREEVAACLLGGYGIPAEVGLAAFWRLRDEGLLERQGRDADAAALCRVLVRPLKVAGRRVKYRFARQKSEYLTAALNALDRESPPTDSELAFRDFFLSLPGFGPKTASWLTRNWLNSDAVAILDIHVYRAGLIAGFFERGHSLGRHYREMEGRLLAFARGIDVRPAVLDALMWNDMRKAGTLPRRLVGGLV